MINHVVETDLNKTKSHQTYTTKVVYPTSNDNIYTFIAFILCNVLDVLAPPYLLIIGQHFILLYYNTTIWWKKKEGIIL